MNSGKNSGTPRETLISLLILSALVSIGAAIVSVQFRFNPAVIQSTGIPVPSTGAEEAVSTAAAGNVFELPPGIQPLSPPETFSPDRLSDKINGKAELYLSAGCKGLRSQRFTDSLAEGRWMEIFIFDMGTHENAFAVYSSQRRGDAVPIDWTQNGYQTQNALYWIHGGYYVELIASEASRKALAAMETMAQRFMDATEVKTAAVAETELFPAAGLDRDSIRMIPADAFGFDKLDRVFAAAYSVEGIPLTAFLSNRPSERAAAELAAAYRDFLVQFGGVDITARSGLELPGAAVIEILGTNEVIFTRGNYLAGVHEAEGLQSAVSVARLLYHRLGESHSAK